MSVSTALMVITSVPSVAFSDTLIVWLEEGNMNSGALSLKS